MMRLFANSMLAAAAVVAVSALAFAEETIIEKRTVEESDAVPAPRERVVEERTVTQDAPVVKKRTETVTTTSDNDNDNDND